ncbi:pectinacetylesterase family protein [Myxococcota bacterium]|nr:pectinacetylesterase family protein [Myxococcota bacterium]
MKRLLSIGPTGAIGAALGLSLAATACDGDAAAPDPSGRAVDAADAMPADATDAMPPDAAPVDPFAEVMAAGLGRYLGTAPAAADPEDAAGVTVWRFDPADGPMCFRGAPFQIATRRGSRSDSLLVFLQGGGACWSDFCFAIDRATEGVPPLDALDPALPENPFADWNVVYLPYCDGSLFVGDVDVDDDGDGVIDRSHRGLRNLSAALDVARTTFPDAARIMLAGSSGGGYGTFLAAPLVRHVWPEASLMVFNDAGVGLGKPGDESFIRGIVSEWNIAHLVPESCADCYANGHLTPMAGWLLERDPGLRIAMFSSTADTVIGTLFLKIGAAAFEGAVREQLGRLATAWPGRFGAFVIEGTQHTTLLGDISGFLGPDSEGSAFGDALDLGSLTTTAQGGVAISDWIDWMLEADPRWTSTFAPE